ncbi:Surface antigen-like protein [Leptomonas seymouri]|uniref:Surface antigen-like protein n=1 Tax=Leptomonas seymouri TaxID=5684 RepID=A0A0N1HZJ5_LEPSE|nr:Surface antigen-like protein [Leptomonas seymouri]|eukprot:KPI82831.1 Surface antigen-like protein [Leptomonas seymouri]
MRAFFRYVVVAAVVTLVLAVSAQAQMISDFPEIDCASTDLEHCAQCHYYRRGTNTFYFCAICQDTDEQLYSQIVDGANKGHCVPYNGPCNVKDCFKCAADNADSCVACNVGVPDQNTRQCLGESLSSATHGKYTTSKSPSSSTITTGDPQSASSITSEPSGPCSIVNCAVCSSDQRTCITCTAGYTLTGTGACMQSGFCAVANCVQCAATNYRRCTTCASGYASNSNGECRVSGNGAVSGPATLLVGSTALAVALAPLF